MWKRQMRKGKVRYKSVGLLEGQGIQTDKMECMQIGSLQTSHVRAHVSILPNILGANGKMGFFCKYPSLGTIKESVNILDKEQDSLQPLSVTSHF